MEDARTTAARSHFDRWSETYEQDSAARWLREVQTEALAALALHSDDLLLDVAVFTLDLVLRVTQRSHAGFRSAAQLMHYLSATGLCRAAYCTKRWRSYAVVRAEKAVS